MSQALRWSLLLALSTPGVVAQPAPRPNVVVILADDMGFSDLGCYGSEIPTPSIDALANDGLRFTQFYNTGRCCPTRASLLTGLYPHQAGVGHMVDATADPGYRGVLGRDCATIAEVLRDSGYRTWMAGKWHVTDQLGAWSDDPRRDDRSTWPLGRGFERFFGTITGAGSYYDPPTLVVDAEPAPPVGDGFLYTTAIGDAAARFVREHAGDEPFFLYCAFTAPHWPLHAPAEDVAARQGRYDAGWDALREARHARQLELGIVHAEWPLTERDPAVPAWETAPDRAWQARRMEVYAAQVVRLDAAVGTIVAALRDTGRLDDTLLLFLADNGGCQEELGGSGSAQTARTHDGRPVRRGNDPAVMPGPEDTYQSYGRPWANASNTPFRRYKHFVHEGGIATPLIVHWPTRVADHGALRDEPGHLIDIMATCVDVAGASYPTERDNVPIQPLEGRSLLPLFGDVPDAVRASFAERTLYWEHEGNRAVRRGRHKLVAAGVRSAWELYDLVADRTETHDLAAELPALVTELDVLWTDYAKRCRVVPPDRWQPESFSDAARFELTHGADLPRDRAPFAVGRHVSFDLDVERDGDGVILAHGGSTHGYAIWVADGRLCFAVCRSGVRSVLRAADALPGGRIRIRGRFAPDGDVELSVGDRATARGTVRGTVPGGLLEMPADGLQVGRDERGSVGGYPTPNPLRGRVHAALIELGPAGR
ncbi:MAG: arylsulfatase [Planctomycetes bacterium]|nr:arylsulfatase [Planctomycetota bacterium]